MEARYSAVATCEKVWAAPTRACAARARSSSGDRWRCTVVSSAVQRAVVCRLTVQAAPPGSIVLLSLLQQMLPGCCMEQLRVACDTSAGWWY